MTLQSRIAALEGASASGLLSVVVHGGLSALGPDDCAKAGGQTWTRAEGEAVETFRARVLAEARKAGAKCVVWG